MTIDPAALVVHGAEAGKEGWRICRAEIDPSTHGGFQMTMTLEAIPGHRSQLVLAHAAAALQRWLDDAQALYLHQRDSTKEPSR